LTQGAPAAFFSYCREDSDFALRLAGDLKAAGARVWLDQLDIIPGQRWDRAVEDALSNCQRMLVILSPSSVSSTNVMDEVSFALEKSKIVIPVIHRDCTVPFRLRRVQHVDFRQDYARGLQELLRTLAVEQEPGLGRLEISEVGSVSNFSDIDEHRTSVDQTKSKKPESGKKRDLQSIKKWALILVGLVLVAALLYFGIKPLWRMSGKIADRVPIHFSDPIPYSLGEGADNPNFVAVADFNRDGKLDVVSANQVTNNVSILLGNGDGTFQTAKTYPAGIAPYAVAIGDFNRDGFLDLAVSNAGDKEASSGISVLLGNGDGTFQPAQHYRAGVRPTELGIGDFNRDGYPDLVVGSWSDNKIRVLMGNGPGGFGPPREFDVAMTTSSVQVGDFNRDGKLDLAVANNGSDTVFVLLGKGDGTFEAARPYRTDVARRDPNVSPWWGAYSVIVADLNGDGNLDLAVTNFSGSNVGVLLGKGDGTFSAPKTYHVGEGPFTIAISDFNGDGYQDLATGNNSNTVSVLLGKGDGAFQTSEQYPAGNSPASVAAGDFNGDGRLDLVAANRGTNTVSVLLNRGDETFTSLTSSPSPSPLGFQVTFTATVTSGARVPEGDVEFKIDDDRPHKVNLTHGTAIFSTTALARGFHKVTAVYKGSSQFSSSDATLTHNVR
jgi:hypothetical protein